MGRLSKVGLVALVQDAISASGWRVEPLTSPGAHPARFTMKRGETAYTVRLYVWNLSHGGRSRADDEFRIQATGIGPFSLEPGGRTLVLGWSDRFQAFAGFDVRGRLGARGTSSSIQVSAATLVAARRDGAAAQAKAGGEWVLGLAPARLAAYAHDFEAAHAGDVGRLLSSFEEGGLERLAADLDALAAADMAADFGRPGEDLLRAQVVRRMEELLGVLQGAKPPASASIGHNNPPEPVDDAGCGPAAEAAVAAVREEIAAARPGVARIARAGSVLARSAQAVEAALREGGRIVEKGKDLARDYAVRALWGAAAPLAVAFGADIAPRLRAAAEAVFRWIRHAVGG